MPAAELKAALDAVRPAVPGKTAKPILANVLIADGVMTGTDLELRIDVEIGWQGPPVLLPHARLLQILQASKADTVRLEVDGTTCVVQCGSCKWTLPTEDSAEFPAAADETTTPVTRLPADQFCRAVRGTVFAADTESSRYALGAVLVEVKDETVSFVATDGRRLCAVFAEHDLAVDDSKTLVPARVMQAIAGAAANAGEESAVQLETTGKAVVATVGGTTITGQLLQGSFPRWRDVIPKREATPTRVNHADLLSATRAAAIVTSEQSKGVTYAFSKDGIWLHGQSAEAGESSVTCEIVEAGDKCSVKLDPVFVTEFLRSLPAESDPVVEVEVVDAQSAVVLRVGDNTGVIMPMAVD